MSAHRVALACLFLVFLVSCASIPDVEYNYYLSKLNVVVTVAQTVDCTKDNASLIIVNTPAVTPTYSADLDRGPYNINIRAVEGSFAGFADSDANFGFYDDGRLKTINQTTTGQGETIIKSFVTLATTVGALTALAKKTAPTKLPECDTIANWGGGKPVSLAYSKELNFPKALESPPFNNPRTVSGNPPKYVFSIPVTDASKQLYTELNKNNKLPNLRLLLGVPTDAGSRALNVSAADNEFNDEFVRLTLQKTAVVDATVAADDNMISKGNITIPEGYTYDLPIPTAALFGMQKFTLALNEAGAITGVEYGKNTGAAGAANAANAIAAAVTPETATAKAADLKAQADVIAQGQRLARCHTNPATCQ